MNTSQELPRCHVIGVLDDGAASLSETAIGHIRNAHVVIGGTRTLGLFAPHMKSDALRHDLTGALAQVPEWIRKAQDEHCRVVVLATGDPLCFGIASYLAAQLCIEAIEVVPNVSTMQLACARLGLPWQDMKFCSLHSKDTGEWVRGGDPRHGMHALLQTIVQHGRLAILTSPENTPDRIARMLVTEDLQDRYEMAVAECLCQPQERIITGISIVDLSERRFTDPNVVLLWRRKNAPHSVLFGLPDASYQQRQPEKGLITKHEVRAVSLARMQLRTDSIVWDIGAGSGAVGLEAARLCRNGHVYAIEKNEGDLAIIESNRQSLDIHNYTLAHGKAPACLEDWQAPDAVFIGGSGGELGELVGHCLRRLQPDGWLVMNFVTLENLSAAIETLKWNDARWDVVQLQASRSKPILNMHRMAAENPVWIVCAQPKANENEI